MISRRHPERSEGPCILQWTTHRTLEGIPTRLPASLLLSFRSAAENLLFARSLLPESRPIRYHSLCLANPARSRRMRLFLRQKSHPPHTPRIVIRRRIPRPTPHRSPNQPHRHRHLQAAIRLAKRRDHPKLDAIRLSTPRRHREKNLAPGKADVWDSGRIASSDSINIPYNGPVLKPQTRYFWQVRVWDNHNQPTTSAPAFFETGLSPSDWTAKWIRRADPVADQELAAVRWLWLPNADAQKVPANTTAEFRYTLHLDAAPTRASLHIVSPGAYIAAVNGTVTGEHKAWGAFDWEEIGPLLKPGDNEIIVKVVAQAKVSAPVVSTAFAASLRITAPDGTQRRIPSDATWQARPDSNAEWQPAHEIGPLTTPLSIGTDRHSEVPGPNRIATDAALLRKDFAIPRTDPIRPPHHHRPRRLPGLPQRQTHRPANSPQPRLDRLQQTRPLPDLRRHPAPHHRRQHHRRSPRRRLARLPHDLGRHPRLPRTRRPPRPTRHHPHRRHPQNHRHRRNLADRPRPHPLLRDLRRRSLRRAPRNPRLERPPLHRQRLDPRSHRHRLGSK